VAHGSGPTRRLRAARTPLSGGTHRAGLSFLGFLILFSISRNRKLAEMNTEHNIKNGMFPPNLA
jgi:hypothetical protein